MSPAIAGIPVAEFALLHAAAIEGHGLEDLGAVAIGVGKVKAAVQCVELLRRRQQVRAVLLFGVAGAYPARHRQDEQPPAGIGELVVVQDDLLGDEGVETPDGFLDLGAMQLGDIGPFQADPRLTLHACELLRAQRVRGVTVSSCSGTERASERMQARSSADIETMEGAAVSFVCRQFELPLLHVRAISNWTGDRDRGEWNLGAAVDAVQRSVRRLLHPVS